jgi:LPPG:FO 2-phospho-L-lactate transferase
VTRLWYDGADWAHPAPGLLDALAQADAIVICPSNPMLSIEPILSIPGVRAALEQRSCPCVVVSPIIAGQAVKGPAAKLMKELSMEVSPVGVAEYYGKLIDGLVVDTADKDISVQQRKLVTNTLMQSPDDRVRLAREVVEWVGSWQKDKL